MKLLILLRAREMNSTITRDEAIDFLLDYPAEFGRMVGFDRLTDELHGEWLKLMILSEDDETLQGHRESYKTTCLSVALAEIMILYPDLRILFMRKTDDDVKEIITQVANILKNKKVNVLVNAIWGVDLKLVKETATEITTNLVQDTRGSSQLTGKGIGGSLTGKHYEIIFTDDIVNLEDRYSKAERDKTKRVYQELQNLKNRGGRFFNTGTPWHKDDCFTKMPPPRKYDCYTTGLLSAEQIQKKKESMEASLFSANYELRHIATEDVIFDNPTKNGDISHIDQAKICHIDASYGGEDFTAFTICKKIGTTYYMFGKMWHKHVDDCLDEIQLYIHEFNVGKIYVENNADKGYLKKELIKRGERCVDYHEQQNKYIKITSYLKAEWKNVVFIQGTDEDYIQQILDFNENAEHDDAPDSCSSCVRLLWNQKDRTGQPKSILAM